MDLFDKTTYWLIQSRFRILYNQFKMKTTNNGLSSTATKLAQQTAKKTPSAISDKVKGRLAAEVEQFRRVRQKEKQIDFDSSPDMVYYIISTKFLKEWQAFSGYEDKGPSQAVGKGPQPEEMNADIVVKDTNSPRLKPGLEQHSDFEIVSKDIMLIFRDYPGPKIERRAFKLDNNKKVVEIYKQQFEYFMLTRKVLEEFYSQSTPRLKVEKGEISRYVKLSKFKEVALDACRKQESSITPSKIDGIRIWKMDRDLNASQYAYHLKKNYSGNKPSFEDGYNIPAKAKQFSRQQTIADFSIADDDIIIIEMRDHYYGWILTDQEEGKNLQNLSGKRAKCEYCQYVKSIKFECQCGKADYCSEECKYKDMRYHVRVCKFADEVDTKSPIDMSFGPDSRKGLAGLQNLGNTCFMNSCLQCMSNTIPLTEYFLSGKFMSEINTKNPIGMKGKISINYAKTIKGLWCQSSSSYSPYILKSSIAEFQPMFSGFSQHDSQQFLSFLLDGLHQDLNRVIVKPTTDTIESNRRPDEVVARESWVNYLKRNQSIVVDLFMGQYKSKVTCPTCQHESITFDPYSTLSLPIPQSSAQNSISTFVFAANYRSSTKKLTVEYSGKSISEWRAYTASQLRLNADDLVYYCLAFDDEIEEYCDTTPIQKIKQTNAKKGFELFCLELTKDDRDIPAIARKAYCFRFINAKTNTTFTFKRPMYFDPKSANGIDVYFRVYKFLFRVLYNKERTMQVPEAERKDFERAFADKNKIPFEIYIRSGTGKESLLKFEESIKGYSADNKIQFDVRVMGVSSEDLKKFNNYDDADKCKPQEVSDNRTFSLSQCFTEFQKAERLEEGNEWFCPKCKQHKLATKQMQIYKTPKILIIHLKRFKQKSDRWFATKQKMCCLVDFPHQLDMGNFTISQTLPEAYFFNSPNTQPLVKPQSINSSACTKYQLFAVSNHYGTMGGGHYTAYAKNDGSWYSFNDSSVSKVSSNEVVSRDAYMLFYRRADIKKGSL